MNTDKTWQPLGVAPEKAAKSAMEEFADKIASAIMDRHPGLSYYDLTTPIHDFLKQHLLEPLVNADSELSAVGHGRPPSPQILDYSHAIRQIYEPRR